MSERAWWSERATGRTVWTPETGWIDGTPTERAAELGREHGERDARAWLAEHTELLAVLSPERTGEHYGMPEPDLSVLPEPADYRCLVCGGEISFATANPRVRTAHQQCMAEYVTAYREARDATIREAVS